MLLRADNQQLQRAYESKLWNADYEPEKGRETESVGSENWLRRRNFAARKEKGRSSAAAVEAVSRAGAYTLWGVAIRN